VLQGYTPICGPSNKSTLVVGESFGWLFASGWECSSSMRHGTGFEANDSFNRCVPSTAAVHNPPQVTGGCGLRRDRPVPVF
jgi:hypothetical protein